MEEIRLLLRGVGRVVCGNGVQGAVPQALNHGQTVILCAQGRIHAIVRVPLFQGLVRQGEIMGAGFRRHRNAPPLSVPNHIHGSPGAHMADMNRDPVSRRQGNLPGSAAVFRRCGDSRHAQLPGNLPLVHNAAFGQIEVLAVGRYPQAQLRGCHHGLGQEFGVLHRPAIIAEGNGSRLDQGFPVAGLFALQALCHCRRHIDVGVRLLGLVQDILHGFRGIHRRIGVGHGQQTGDTARSSGPATGENVLLLGEARVPQVNVHIHQTRRGHQPHAVNLPASRQAAQTAHGGDFSVFHGNIPVVVLSLGRVHNPCPPNQQILHLLFRPFSGCANDSLLSRNWQTFTPFGRACSSRSNRIGYTFLLYRISGHG